MKYRPRKVRLRIHSFFDISPMLFYTVSLCEEVTLRTMFYTIHHLISFKCVFSISIGASEVFN